MQINKRLNLVVPVSRSEGTMHVHATPLSRATFEANFLLISKTFANIYTAGLGATAGPRVAGMMLKDVALDLDGGQPGSWSRRAGDLMNEVRRLANVVPIGGSGAAVPLQDAVDQKLIDEDEASEVENAIVFFIVASAMHSRSDLPAILGGVSRLWDAQTTSLGFTEFAASLRTSTAIVSSGENASAPAAVASPPVTAEQGAKPFSVPH